VTRPAADPLLIGLLLPDVLGTYADRGNAVVLAQRARWRSIPVDLIELPVTAAPSTVCDVYVLGGGEDAAQVVAARWIAERPALRRALERAQVMAVCAGLQLLGTWMTDARGRRHAGAGILDLTTVPGPRRAVGEMLVDAGAAGGLLTGFENHRGRTRLGPGLAPLGRVHGGTGNGDGWDGVLTGTVLGTYLHGPVLARNPRLADLVLRRALGTGHLPRLEVPDEDAARALHLGDRRGRPARWAGLRQRAVRSRQLESPARPAAAFPTGAAQPGGAPQHIIEMIEGARGDCQTSTEAMRWVPPDSPDRLRCTGA
jgi:lipid II isoglutaminyl synthase (glutamine-hydrolysing)